MRLRRPYNKPNSNNNGVNSSSRMDPMMMMIVPMPNPMVPSSNLKSTSLSSSAASLSTGALGHTTGATSGSLPMLHPEDPNLYCIPPDLSSVYKALPFRLRMFIGVVSTYIFASRSVILRTALELFHTSTNIGIVWWLPIRLVRILLTHSEWAKRHVLFDLIKIFIKSYIVYTISTIFVQDFLLPKYSPSRISMSELISQYRTLPSTYSNYHQLVTEFNLTNATFQYQPNVHYLKAVGNNSTNDAKTESFHMDAIYVNHGFGASSLSWLPTIPYLLPHTKLVLGHDAPGFGFTDRVSKNHSSSFEAQRQTSYYSISHSAAMGTKLLQNHILPLDDAQSNADTKILLMGHSLGTLTTLRMALQQQNNTSIRQQIVLVSPAVGLRKPNKNDDTTLPSTIITTTSAENINRLEPKQSVLVRSTRRNMALPLFVRRLLQRIGTSVACYGLKRLVGRTNFWRYGLQQMVWNNDIARKNHKHKLRDCDVLRYQWPAIVQDWEIGLVQFTSEQMSSSSTRTTLRNQVGDAMMTEVELIQAVLDLPNVQAIHVIVGSNDRVIPNTAIINFFQKHFPNHINVTIMDGFGHNPFEEDPELFVATIQTIIGE